MDLAIGELQKEFLTEAEIASGRVIMGIDTQPIKDATYFVVESNKLAMGCGGCSRRRTLFGGDQSPGRDADLLDPKREPARVRAMYTHPTFTRRGIGRLILRLCEDAARLEGFTRVELMATLAGEPLYRACGYDEIGRTNDASGGVPVPILRMGKNLS